MGKRQERIQGDTLAQKSKSLAGKEVQIILWTGETFAGKVSESENNTISLVSKGAFWYNLKRNTHTFTFAQIREIIREYEADW
ncbi:MAG: hypothetical protein K1X92_03230 [Bacteroidia bacterium]|nr:hypothetical protein [Bacteroidia bacterium]